MIQPSVFLRSTRAVGIDFVTGTPCSLLTPLIDAAIDDPRLRYVRAVNEGDAVAMACGAAMGGARALVMFQNSGLGNAVNALTSLAYPFRIPVLLVITHRGDPAGDPDEPQHAQMGAITRDLLDLMEIAWRPLPRCDNDMPAALEEAVRHMDATGRSFAFVVSRKHVAASGSRIVHEDEPVGRRSFRFVESFTRRYDQRATRADVITTYLTNAQRSDIVVATTGYTGRELLTLAERPNDFYMVGSMGSASAVGLGLALQLPQRRIIVLDGDGAALMRLGNLAAVGAERPPNFVHLVLDNEVHDSTGGQETVSRSVSFATIGLACGYEHVLATDALRELDEFLTDGISAGPTLIHFKTKAGTLAELRRPDLQPFEVKERLMAHLQAGLRDHYDRSAAPLS